MGAKVWTLQWLLGMWVLVVGASVGIAKPDLVVTDIVLDPSMPGAGDGTLTATIKNIGPDGTGIFVNIDITMYLDGVKCDEGIILAGLGAGKSATEDTTSCNPSSPGVHTIKFVVDTTSEVSESNENNNALEKSFTWTGPDLVFTDLVLSPANPPVGSGKLTATVKNQGPVGTDTLLNIDITMYLDGQKCDEGIIIAGLGAGKTATEDSTSCVPKTPGQHTVKFVVDSTSEVAETSESNNTIEKTFTWTGPDLVFLDLKLDPAMPGADDGTLTATIKNQGTAGTDTLLNIDVAMYLDGVKCDTGLILAGLGAGKTATEETGSCNPKTPGVHTVKFVVDSTNEVPETDETNNTIEKTFTWTGPDLVFLDLKLDPAMPGADDGTLTATIKNQGPVGTDTLLNIDVTMYLDGQKCDEGIIIAGLGAGKTATEDSTKCNPKTPGPHVIKWVVDSTSEVAETDEGNNSIEKTFIWSAADLVVTAIKVDPDPPEPGEDVKFTATFENKGPVDTGCVTINLTYHLDGAEEPCDDGWIVCGLGAGKTTTDETTKCVPTTPGEHTLTVKVDTDNDVVELDEENNELKKTFGFVVCGKVELCNGKDDNCDGQIDEGFLKAGTSCDGPTDTDSCKDGVIVCAPDEKTAQCEDDAAGKVELCNGIDDDCDAQIDEDFPKLDKVCEGVECKAAGVYVCSEDQKDVVCKKGEPPAEICNGKDDDCDGDVDEDYPMVGKGCAEGIGACRVIGQLTCAEGYLSCDAEPGQPAGKEECGNVIDENCNGMIDEGCECEPGTFLPCGLDVGTCQSGVLPCLASGVFFDVCVDAVTPGLETCDGKDDDCDGSIDEDCECDAGDEQACDAEAGVCKTGKQHCVDGAWGLCEVVGLTEDENCDEVDNDCDGSVDPQCPCAAGQKKPCDFAPDDCAEYQRVCVTGGIFGACSAIPGTQVPNCKGGTGGDKDSGTTIEDDVSGGGANDDVGTGGTEGPDGAGGITLDVSGTKPPTKSSATDDGGCNAHGGAALPLQLILWCMLVILWKGVTRLRRVRG